MPANGCIKRQSEENGDEDGYFCVCNAEYCDEAPDMIRPLNPAKYVLITSSKTGLFFHMSNGVFININKTVDGKYSFCQTPESLKKNCTNRFKTVSC